jgi:ribose transport system permease protein
MAKAENAPSLPATVRAPEVPIEGPGGPTVTGRGGPPDASDSKNLSKKLGELALRFGMVLVLIALVIAAQIIYPGFLAWGNIQNVLSQNAQVGIIAVGMTFVMIAGGFDLSVGAIYAFCAVLYADFANSMGLIPALLLVIVAGGLMGTINGLVVTKLKVNPFVATLGSASVFGGAAFLYSNSSPVLNNKPGFESLGQNSFAGLPISVWLMIIIFVVGAFVLHKSVYGRSLFSIGGNDEASRLAGLRVDSLRASTYVIVGVCAAVGGAIIASRLQVGQADVGSAVALDAIAVVVIGGTSLFGGEGAVWRSAIGLLILAVITNLCDSKGLNVNVQSVIKGGIVIGAVALDSFSRRRRA